MTCRPDYYVAGTCFDTSSVGCNEFGRLGDTTSANRGWWQNGGIKCCRLK